MDPHGIELLKRTDEELFTEGACHIFAIALNERFGFPICLLSDAQATPPSGVVHVYCMCAPDTMIDIVGKRSEQVYLDEGCYFPPFYRREEVTIEALTARQTLTFGSGGLYFEPCFFSRAKLRAQGAIERSFSTFAPI